MAQNPKDITSANDLRDFIRELYIESFQGRGKHTVVEAESTANDLKTRIHYFFNETFIEKNEENEDAFKFDSRSVNENPLFPIWKMCHFSPAQMAMDFGLLDLLVTNKYGVTEYDLRRDGRNFYSYLFTPKTGSDFGRDHKTVEITLRDLEKQGIIKSRESGKSKLYTLTDTSNLKSILSRNDALNAIRFASETLPCGVIGSFILDNLDKSDYKTPVFFKHHFIYNTLDSEIIFILLDAIKNKNCIKLQFKKSEKEIIPLEIRHTIRDGRTHLIFYDFSEELFYAANIENITAYAAGSPCPNYESIYKDFLKKRKFIVGKSFLNKEPEKLSFTICFTDEEKSFIPERLKREAFVGTVKTGVNSATYEAELFDTGELRPWIRTYWGRITDFKCDNILVKTQLEKEIKQIYSMYFDVPEEEETEKCSDNTENDETKKTSGKLKKTEPDINIFFNRIYSSYYSVAIKVIKAFHKKEIKDLFEYLGTFPIFKANTQKRTENKIYNFTDSADLIFGSSCKIKNDIEFTLSTMEISFIKAMLDSPQCRLFLENETIEKLEEELSKTDFINIEPYYNQENFILYDQFLNGDGKLQNDPDYKKMFNTILDAVTTKEKIKFTYSEYGVTKEKISIPEKIEYSQKEDRFKVVLDSKKRPLDLKNIIHIESSDEPLSEKADKEFLTCQVAIIDHTPTHYHRDRFFREFSTFQKNCRQIDEAGHLFSFEFEKGDAKEIAIRLLQFGPNIMVTSPDIVVDRIKEKIEAQYKLLAETDK